MNDLAEEIELARQIEADLEDAVQKDATRTKVVWLMGLALLVAVALLLWRL